MWHTMKPSIRAMPIQIGPLVSTCTAPAVSDEK